MPQTIGAINTVDGLVEFSTNGTSWTNVSGSSNKVEASTLTADEGSAATLEGQYKIVRVGKFNPLELAITILYTEVASEAWAIVKAQYALPGHPLYVRITPGGYNGEDRFYTADASGNKAAGRIKSLQFPGVNAEDPAPTLLNLVVSCTQLAIEHNIPSPSASLSPSASPSA